MLLKADLSLQANWVLVLAKVPRQLPPHPGDGLQAHLVPAAKGVNSQGEEGDGFGAALRLELAQLLLVGVGDSRVPIDTPK